MCEDETQARHRYTLRVLGAPAEELIALAKRNLATLALDKEEPSVALGLEYNCSSGTAPVLGPNCGFCSPCAAQVATRPSRRPARGGAARPITRLAMPA